MQNCGWIKYGFGPEFNDTYVPFYSKKHTYLEKCLHIDYTNNGFVNDTLHPLDAGVMAVQKITEECPAPYVLMLSGGLDSQVMLYIWHKSGVPFTTRTYTYNRTYNLHDVSNLTAFANKLNVEINWVDIDALNFFETELYEYAFRYHCSSPQICLYIKMAEPVKYGTVIFSGNFIDKTSFPLNYNILGLHRYQLLDNANIVPFFLMFTPELAYSIRNSFLTNIKKVNFKKDKQVGYQIKTQTLLNSGIPVIPQVGKLSGFEGIKDHYDMLNPINSLEKLKYHDYGNNFSRRSFDIRIRYALEAHMPYSNKSIQYIA